MGLRRGWGPAAVVLTAGLLLAACSDGQEQTTDLVSQAADGNGEPGSENVGNAPDAAGTPTVETTDTTAEPTTESTADGAPDTTSETTGPPVADQRCSAAGYELAPPAAWFQFGCRYLSPAPISVDPATCDCQFPIDLAVARNETYDEALERIRSRPDVWRILEEETLFVDGRVATRLDTLVDVDGRTVDRRLIVADLGNGTLFVAATDRADQAPSGLAYETVLGALDDLLRSMSLRPL